MTSVEYPKTVCLSTAETSYFVLNADTRVDECPAQPESLIASSGTIQSPGYDSSTYRNDANCQWIIEAPQGKVRLMSTLYVY